MSLPADSLRSDVFIGITLAGMIGAFVLALRYRRRMEDLDRVGAQAGIGSVNAAIFGLLGLLVAFSFSGAEQRFDARRAQIVEEANDIGTAYLRIDLLPAEVRPKIRADFGRYVDSRLAIYRALPDVEAARRLIPASENLQNLIWAEVTEAAANDSAAKMLNVSALNTMIDITTTRFAATEIHPPKVVFVMLSIISVLSVFLVGFEMAKSKTWSRLHAFGFAGTLLLTIVVILDFEYPRMGFIRIDPMDHLLVDLRRKMP